MAIMRPGSAVKSYSEAAAAERSPVLESSLLNSLSER
jgi:hypothetical protein